MAAKLYTGGHDLKSLLQFKPLDDGTFRLLPYAYYRASESSLGVIPLQYDGPDTAGHHCELELERYIFDAPVTVVEHDGRMCVVHLVTADAESPTREYVAMRFGAGILWGRFPKL